MMRKSFETTSMGDEEEVWSLLEVVLERERVRRGWQDTHAFAGPEAQKCGWLVGERLVAGTQRSNADFDGDP